MMNLSGYESYKRVMVTYSCMSAVVILKYFQNLITSRQFLGKMAKQKLILEKKW